MNKMITLTLVVATIALSFTGCSNTGTASNSSNQTGAAASPSNRGTTGGNFGGGDLSANSGGVRP